MSVTQTMHPALTERLAELAGEIPLAEAFAAVDVRGPADLPAVIRYLIERRRADDTVPRPIPISNRRHPPTWLFTLAGEPTPDARQGAGWPASLLESPLEREPNPLMRMYLALAMRGRATLTPPRRWAWFIQVVRLAVLGLLIWLAARNAGHGPALLVALVVGAWMLLATPHVAERVAHAAAVLAFNDAVQAVLEDDMPPDESLSPPSAAP